MAYRHELSEAEWARIAPLRPRRETRGTDYRDHQTTLDGILHRHATGCPWRGCSLGAAGALCAVVHGGLALPALDTGGAVGPHAADGRTVDVAPPALRLPVPLTRSIAAPLGRGNGHSPPRRTVRSTARRIRSMPRRPAFPGGGSGSATSSPKNPARSRWRGGCGASSLKCRFGSRERRC